MRVPEAVLHAVRGSTLALALGGCTAAVDAPPLLAPEPGPPMTPVVVEASDVTGDGEDGEAERLERLERTLAAADRRRTARIEELRIRQLPRVACGRG